MRRAGRRVGSGTASAARQRSSSRHAATLARKSPIIEPQRASASVRPARQTAGHERHRSRQRAQVDPSVSTRSGRRRRDRATPDHRVAGTVGRQRAALADLRRQRRLDGALSRVHRRTSARAAGVRHLSVAVARAVPFVALQGRRGHVRDGRHRARGQGGPLSPSSPRTWTSSVRPAAIFCFIDRVMGPPQWSDLGHVPADVHAARAGSRSRHVPAGGVGGLRERGQRVRRAPPRSNGSSAVWRSVTPIPTPRSTPW